MNSFFLFYVVLRTFITICSADPENLQDVCPTDTTKEKTVLLNGFPCKNPANITASDFKSSKLNHAGDIDHLLHSSLTLVTAADFPGLNTLGLSIARTDLDVDGIVMPHSHSRASEMFFVRRGVVIAGFIDTTNKLFQKTLNQGDVFVLPRGLPHFCLNAGNQPAVVFSVLNGQNPGVVKISNSMFDANQDAIINVVKKLRSVAELELDVIENVTFL